MSKAIPAYLIDSEKLAYLIETEIRDMRRTPLLLKSNIVWAICQMMEFKSR